MMELQKEQKNEESRPLPPFLCSFCNFIMEVCVCKRSSIVKCTGAIEIIWYSTQVY